MTKQETLLALNSVSGLGNRRLRKLLEYFGSARKVLSVSLEILEGSKIVPRKVAEKIVSFDETSWIKQELKLMHACNAHAISFEDSEYPSLLREIPDAPVVLYCKGELDSSNNSTVAIVGSRRATFYGTAVSEKFATRLAEFGITVVSGMARGIDAAAHRGALKAKGATIAVLGSGLANIYPAEHKQLCEQIASSGAVISEFPMTTPPIAHNFPRRNRIISGLSLGVVVVEASQRSGALITSDCALEQGREVFAVPGKVDSPTAYGVNSLIKQGAKLVSSVEDIIDELKFQIVSDSQRNILESDKHAKGILPENLTEDEMCVYNSLNTSPVHIDEISRRLNIAVSKIMSILLCLELRKCVKQFPGKLFAKAQ